MSGDLGDEPGWEDLAPPLSEKAAADSIRRLLERQEKTGLFTETTIYGPDLRDRFACAAMEAVLVVNAGLTPEELSRGAYNVADAMLAERKRRKA